MLIAFFKFTDEVRVPQAATPAVRMSLQYDNVFRRFSNAPLAAAIVLLGALIIKGLS